MDYIIHKLILNSKKTFKFYKPKKYFQIEKHIPNYVWGDTKRIKIYFCIKYGSETRRY